MRHSLMATIAAVTLVVLAGCAAPPPLARAQFPVDEYEALPKSGTGAVTGQAFLRTRGGTVKTAAGSEVMLNPVTSYSLEWHERSYIPSQLMVPPDPRLDRYIITKVANGSGDFRFKDVPPGDYFVVTKITWEVPFRSIMTTEGAVVAKRITVKDGEETEVVLTR